MMSQSRRAYQNQYRRMSKAMIEFLVAVLRSNTYHKIISNVGVQQ
jgi:hypothetical protein